jgi:hypothetical protein
MMRLRTGAAPNHPWLVSQTFVSDTFTRWPSAHPESTRFRLITHAIIYGAKSETCFDLSFLLGVRRRRITATLRNRRVTYEVKLANLIGQIE